MPLSSCTERKQEILKIVQLCVKNEADMQLLSQEMKFAVMREGLTLIDNSKATQEELSATAKTAKQKRDALWAVSFYAGNNDGTGVNVSNVDMSPNDITLAFAYDHDAKAATVFSDRLTARLAKHWRIIPIALDSGPVALKECASVAR